MQDISLCHWVAWQLVYLFHPPLGGRPFLHCKSRIAQPSGKQNFLGVIQPLKYRYVVPGLFRVLPAFCESERRKSIKPRRLGFNATLPIVANVVPFFGYLMGSWIRSSCLNQKRNGNGHYKQSPKPLSLACHSVRPLLFSRSSGRLVSARG